MILNREYMLNLLLVKKTTSEMLKQREATLMFTIVYIL